MFFFNRKKLFTRSQTRRICSPYYRQCTKKKTFKGDLFDKIHFQNFQKNHRHFLNFENFDIFLQSFDRAKNSSSHEKKTNRICIVHKKLHHFGKYFGSFNKIVRFFLRDKVLEIREKVLYPILTNTFFHTGSYLGLIDWSSTFIRPRYITGSI